MLKKLYSYCIQGNVLEAYNYIKSLPESKTTKALEQKYYNRFFKDQPILRVKSKDPWIRNVILAYYHYFIAVLTKRLPEQRAEEELLHKLVEYLPTKEVGYNDIDQVEEALELQFNQRGYYFLGGITSPYRGPYIWKGLEKRVYQVSLPNGTQEVTVYFMTDFILHSWLHFATFGVRAAGGWAKEEGLYCVYDRYKKDLESTTFNVTFLKHEAQHLNDYSRFPNLSGQDLEYRAKLIELIYAPSYQLLHRFLLEAKDDPTLHHPYASYLICKNFTKELFHVDHMEEQRNWRAINPSLISETALKLYDQHTEQLLMNVN